MPVEVPEIQIKTTVAGAPVGAAPGSNDAQALAYHRKHIQALWAHLERLERFITMHGDGSFSITVGQSSISMKKDGSVTIRGNHINIEGSGGILIKTGGTLALKGAKIAQN
jgi:type VI secretion system secreted protein VgrG